MSGKKLKKNASHPDATESHYVPYTADELAESRGQRKFLNAVNVLNARLWMCVHFAECACEALKSGDHYRAYSYFRALDIGNEFVSASIASAIQKIREQIISKGEGNAPIAGSVNGLVKVLATYIQLRLEIHATDSIIRADRAGRAIANMLTSHDITCGDSEKFATYVNTTFATLISSLEDHYDKTALILSSRIENCRPEPKPVSRQETINVRIVKDEKPKKTAKAHAKQTPFMLEQVRIFKAYLDKHPVCASYSIINRARQCWFEHKAEWDKAAKNKTGYANYKNLARAV